MKALVQEDSGHGLKLTPLIDVVFLLLVFFLVATTFYEEERDITIELAKATEGAARDTAFQSIMINIRDSGIIVINQRIHSMDQTNEFLGEALDLNPDVSVIIRCDRAAVHDHFVRVLNLCEKLDVRNVSVATHETKQPIPLRREE